MGLTDMFRAGAQAREAEAGRGARHRYDIHPNPPAADEPCTLRLRVPSAEPITGATAIVAGAELPFACAGTDGTDDVWEAVIPGQPDGTVVRYRIRLDDGRMVEDAGPGYEFPVPGVTFVRPPVEVFSYRVGGVRVPDWVPDAVIYHLLVDRFARSDGVPFPSDDELPFLGFVGGTLRGLIDRLDHIAHLGCDAILISPITPGGMHVCYDHTDLFGVEPRLGTMADVRELLREAHGRGIRVLLDLVLSYVGQAHPRVGSNPEWFHHHEERPFGWFGSTRLVAVDHTKPDARQYLLDGVRHWLDVGFDGFRLDSAHAASHDFWTDFAGVVADTNPDAYAFGEVMQSMDERLRHRGRLHGTLAWDVCEAIRGFCGRGDVDGAGVAEQLMGAFDLPGDYAAPTFVESHDVDRFDMVSGHDPARVRMALALLLALPGPPMLYYGTEVGMGQTRTGDVDLVARAPMRWNGAQDRDVYDDVRRMIDLRRKHPALRRGSFRPVVADDDVFAFVREAAGDRVVVVANAGDAPAVVDVDGQAVRAGPLETVVVVA